MDPDRDSSPPRETTVAPDRSGWRLDRVLAEVFADLSRSRIQALIAEGRVTADGATIGDANHRVKPGQRLALRIPQPVAASPKADAIPLSIVYEDDDIVVLDKPAGLVVHPAPGNPDRTLVNALIHHCGASLSGIGGVRRPGIVHRIDKDTSGLLVIAKNDRAHAGLAEQFASHRIERAYWAIVAGIPAPARGRITGAIGRNPRNRKAMAIVRPGRGKDAVSEYRVVRSLGGLAALVECRLETGRTHQIRVHMASLGHPVVGDPVYGGRRHLRRLPEAARKALEGLPGQALHAYLLGFNHPVGGKPMRFEADIPSNISRLIEALEA
ncbi:MAG: RluA family pseudouridine synthase [Alphaproteobacteria bacterium]|nr:RluA family pseudouridine synthase [Alphaproteobacteria bacterium]